MLLFKYCKKEHNLARGCKQIRLGTLRGYAKGDPKFCITDPKEGVYKITNDESKNVVIESESLTRLSSGGIVGGRAVIENGAKINIHHNFPNCYIFCLANTVVPSLEIAKQLEASYDDWYVIFDINKFIKYSAQLLIDQIQTCNLDLSQTNPVKFSLKSVQNLRLKVVHRPCSYESRIKTFDQDSINSAAEAGEDPMRWLFAKEEADNRFNEHRIAYIFLDEYDRMIPVRHKAKFLDLTPDLGVSLFE